MDYVKTLRRIAALQKADQRAQSYLVRHNCDAAECVIFRIEDKITDLQGNLHRWWWNDTEGNHALRCIRHKQLNTACRLLGLDRSSTLQGYRYFPA